MINWGCKGFYREAIVEWLGLQAAWFVVFLFIFVCVLFCFFFWHFGWNLKNHKQYFIENTSLATFQWKNTVSLSTIHWRYFFEQYFIENTSLSNISLKILLWAIFIENTSLRSTSLKILLWAIFHWKYFFEQYFIENTSLSSISLKILLILWWKFNVRLNFFLAN